MKWPGAKSSEYWLGQIWAKLVGGINAGQDGEGAVASVVVSEKNWTTIINAVRIDDAPTAFNSSIVTVTGWSGLLVLLFIDSTLAPTNIRFIAQHSDDGGATWWDFEEGLWASLMWEDTDTASGVRKSFLLPCAGHDTVRIRAVGTGTDAGNYFDITVKVKAFRGSFATAHA